jgi:hypothetical protein
MQTTVHRLTLDSIVNINYIRTGTFVDVHYLCFDNRVGPRETSEMAASLTRLLHTSHTTLCGNVLRHKISGTMVLIA